MIHTAVGGVKHNSNHFTLDRALDNFLYFSSPFSSRKSTETRPRLSVITSWSSRFHEVSSCLVIILVIAIVYNYVCVLLCLLLCVQRECVVCTACVKGKISRVLFINIHIIYIFCFFLRIFSADQSVLLNRPSMCIKLTSTHTCINEVKYTSFVLHITCTVVFCEKMHQNCSIFILIQCIL